MNNDVPNNILLDRLYFSSFTFNAEVTEDIYLSEYKGSAFSGGFGFSFKKLVCINPQETNCDNCILNKNCSYYKIFKTNIDNELAQKLHITKTAPRPYVIQQPLTNQRKLNKGELFSFNLILVGWAIEYLPYFIIVFERLGEKFGLGQRQNNKKGRFRIVNVTSSGKEIYSSNVKMLSSDFEKRTISADSLTEVKRVKINFVTPTRLQLNGKAVMINHNGGFTTFMIGLYGRLFRLQSIYCNNGEDITEYNHHDLETLARKINIISANLRWHDLKRPLNSLNSQKSLPELEWMKYGGFVGEVTFEGELTPLISLLKLGEHLHVGKYYTFGLGRYEILEMS